MTHMKRKLTLLLMCLLLLGGVAMASSGEIESDASEEISEEAETESEAPPEEEPVAASNEARDYINYYLMPGDSPYLEAAEAAEYIYTAADAANYEQIVFSAMDWNGLSEAAQAEVDAALPEGYLVLLQEAVDYAAVNAGGVVGSAAYVVTFEGDAETSGEGGGIAVAEIIEEAGLSESIYIPDAPALLADFGSDSAVRYNYGWWGGGRIYYGTKTGTLGPLYIGSPFGDAAATYVTAALHTDYFYSSYMGAYYDCYCLSARSTYPKNKWVASSGESKWNALSSSQRTGLAKAMLYGQLGHHMYETRDLFISTFLNPQLSKYSSTSQSADLFLGPRHHSFTGDSEISSREISKYGDILSCVVLNLNLGRIKSIDFVSGNSSDGRLDPFINSGSFMARIGKNIRHSCSSENPALLYCKEAMKNFSSAIKSV